MCNITNKQVCNMWSVTVYIKMLHTWKYPLKEKGDTHLTLHLNLAQNKYSSHIHTNTHQHTVTFSQLLGADADVRCVQTFSIHPYVHSKKLQCSTRPFEFYSCRHGKASETGFRPRHVTMLRWNIKDTFTTLIYDPFEKCHM